MGLIESIKAKAKSQLRTIVLPESEDERVLKAAQSAKRINPLSPN